MTNRTSNNSNRTLMAAVCFAAALTLTACGGEGGGEGSRLDSTVPFSERESGNSAPDGQVGTDGSASPGSSSGTDDVEDSNSLDGPEDSSSSEDLVDSDNTETSKGEQNPQPGSGGGTAEQDPAPSEDGTAEQDPAAGEEDTDADASSQVVLRWGIPNARQNGDDLLPEELGGYEIRYRKLSESEFRTVAIEDGAEDRFYFDEEWGDGYEFQIAAYDSSGLYSEFVEIEPYFEGS